MDFIKFFEQPLPIIYTDICKIDIDMNENDTMVGVINIKNKGKSTLSGTILYNEKYINFKEDTFSGNNILIEYNAVFMAHSEREQIEDIITIMSNGGEIHIPLRIVYKNSNHLQCGEQKIYNIEQFYKYYLKNNVEAIRTLYSYDFLLWLKNIQYRHIVAIDEMLKDTNKQRAIDNFFVLSGVKEKAYIEILQQNFKYRYFKTKDNTDIIGEIPIKLVGEGYFEDDISLKDNNFLKIANREITHKDFDKQGHFNIKFTVIKNNIEKSYEKINVSFTKTTKNVIIELIEKKPLEIVFSKAYVNYTEKSSVKIINNTGNDVLIEISSKDTFINFYSERYIVSKYAEIPFEINVTGFLKFQMDFFKKPNIETEIIIKASIGGYQKVINKKIHISGIV